MPAYQTDRFRLSAAPGCADGYPAVINEGRFTTSDEGIFPVPYGHERTGNWGNWGGTAVGDEMQPAPDSLEIRWFSYTENKFYEGHFLLPQQRIHALLKQEFWQPAAHAQGTHDELALSVVPGGAVVVWLRGRLNHVLIGRYQASEINYPFAQFAPGANRGETLGEAQDRMSAEARHAQATHAISSRKWDDYLKTYPWQLAFSRPLTLASFGSSCVNAETLEAPPTPDLAAFAQVLLAPSPQPVPTSLGLTVAGPYGRRRSLSLRFPSEQETQAAFRKLAAAHPQQPLTLFVEPDERLTSAVVSLRAGGQVVALPASKVTTTAVE